MKNFKLIKLLALFVVLITSINTMWAGGTWYSTNMWQIWGWKTGYANDGWVKTGLGSGDDFNIGVITASSDNYTFKGLGVNTGGNKVKWVGAQVWYPNGTNGWITVGNHNDGTPGDYYWENKSIWNYSIDKNANPGDYCISIHFYMNDGGSNYNENERKINWTIPGFKTDNPTSFSFGSNSPLNLESVAKIGIRHYGTQPSLGGCVLSGTHASQFEVIDVDYSGVTVVFKPTSVGTKTATLTITDTYSKVWTVTLTGTGAANTATTRLYFNNYNYNSNWITDGALPRFTCEYTTGIYTRYPMTKCANSTYNWYADVEIKGATVNVDRYNPSSPYNTWNTVSMSGVNASNPYAVLDNYSGGTYYGFATNHPYNDVSGGYIYYDNSESDISSTLYFIIGHDYKMEDGGASSTYSKTYSMTPVTNTQLYYRSLSDTWHDADYYAVIGASSDPVGDHKWGSSSLGSKGTGGNTGIFRDILDLKTGNAYLGTSNGGGAGLTMTKRASSAASGLNYTQTIKYALSTDGGSTYPDMTSGNTPGQISVSAYKFVDGTYTSVTNTSNTATISSNTSGTYSTSVPAAYTGKTTLSADARTGYTFVDWNGASTPCNPKAATTYTARYKAHRYTIAFSNNDAQYSSAPAATGSTASISNVVYDQNVTLTANGFEREGYTFAGWSTTPAGDVVYTNGRSVSNLTATDGATVTLYAQWNEILHDITVEYKYGETSVQVDGKVEDVGIVTTKDATAPATIGGYSFTEWSDMPSDVQTSSALTGRTITINATADGQTITANYEPSTYVGTIDGVDGGDGAYSIVYNETSLTATTPATRDGYEVGGYYLNYDEKANPKYYNQIAAGDGSFLASISTYTDENKKWIRTSAPATIYASWTPKPYDITLHAELPGDATGSVGTSKITATMGTTTFSPNAGDRTMPSENGYNFLGYFTDDTPSNIQILNANGTNYLGTKYIDGDGNWSWADNIDAYGHWSAKTYTVSLDPENGSSTTDITATFDATTNLSRIVKPSKTGYTFAGYYTGQGGSGTQLINADGDWIASVSGYTGDNGSGAATWKYYTNSTITLYAKWTQTINFNQNSATVNGTTSLAATYHTTLSTAGIENPKRIGYAFAGWATAADGTVVIGTDGTVNSVDGYTDGSKNWVHAGESTLYAKWTADVKTFTGNGEGAASVIWNNPDNWSDGVVPTNDYSEVHIERGVNIGSGESYHVGKIIIEPNHTLTLINGGVLEVAGTITRPDDQPTETYEISISSGGSEQSALIFDNTAGTTKASVSMWTTAKYNPSTSGYSFQYVAVPMTMVNVSDAFSGQNVYTYVWNEGSGWERRNYYYSLFGFEAVGVTSKDGMVAHTTGTLVSTANIVNRPLSYTSGDGVGMNMIGNSWTAPIKISEMEITGNAESTVYVYNSSTGSWVGNPTAVSGDAIVPAMQAYLIKATSGGGSLSIDYDKAVRGVAASDRTAPLFAPKRDASSAGISEIRMRVSDDEDFYSVLRLFENEQFTDEFDNGWEARYIAGEGFTGQLYAQTDDKMTVLATPDLEGIVVGFIPGVASSYTVSFEGDGKGYYLNDVEAKKSTLIEEGNTYTFSRSDNYAARFIISRTPIQNLPTGVGNVNDGAQARKVIIDNKIYIIRGGRMYDTTGALVK